MTQVSDAAKKYSWVAFEHSWKAVTIFIAICGMLWTVARPAAETFIKDTVKSDVDQRIGRIERSNKEQEKAIISVQEQLKGIERAQNETNQNFRSLFNTLQRNRGWKVEE